MNEKRNPDIMPDKLVNDIKGLINSFHTQMEAHLPVLKAEVNRLIEEKSKENQAIEQLLDTLLSLATIGIGEQLFIQLVEYYKSVESEGAAFYWNEFDSQE